MRISINTLYISVLSIFVICISCSSPSHSEDFIYPVYEWTSNNLPWVVYEGEFRTKDIDRAQEEIPFTIVLPKYVPDNESDVLPEIRGPIKEYQRDGRVEVSIYYILNLGGEENGIIAIDESNYTIIPPDPSSDSEVEFIEIKGIRMIKTVKSFHPIYFHFNYNDICFTAEFMNYHLPIEEAIKVIESMIK